MENHEDSQEYVEKGIWVKIKETIGKVPFVPDAIAMYHCALDAKTPLHARAIAFSALAYFISFGQHSLAQWLAGQYAITGILN